MTPKQRVLRRRPSAHLSRDCGSYCVGSERMGIIGVGRTARQAWGNAAKAFASARVAKP